MRARRHGDPLQTWIQKKTLRPLLLYIRRLVKRDTTNAEAYQFYLRGRFFWNKRTAEGMKKAIEQFQQTIERDPNYALGYVGLADSYTALEEYAGVPASETLPKAKAAADRALQLCGPATTPANGRRN